MKFKGETCVYCNKAPAETADHVVARKFFLVSRRSDFPQVPACQRCNCLKSELENYLMKVFPFGAKHRDAVANLKGLVKHRLDNPSNTETHRNLKRDLERSEYSSIGFDSARAEELFAMIARALAWHHYDVRLGDGFSSVGTFLGQAGEALWTEMLYNGRNPVAGDLGDGTFSYEGVQGEYPELTIWWFKFYGGIEVGGDPNAPGPSSLAVAYTGRAEVIRNFKYRVFQNDPKAPKVGRNDLCPCGSGKKHKKCHGSAVTASAHIR